MKNITPILFILLLLSHFIHVYGQLPVIKHPQPASLSSGVIVGTPSNASQSNIPDFRRNLNSSNTLDMHERDRLELSVEI